MTLPVNNSVLLTGRVRPLMISWRQSRCLSDAGQSLRWLLTTTKSSCTSDAKKEDSLRLFATIAQLVGYQAHERILPQFEKYGLLSIPPRGNVHSAQ